MNEKCPKCHKPFGKGYLYPHDPHAPDRIRICYWCYWSTPEPEAKVCYSSYAFCSPEHSEKVHSSVRYELNQELRGVDPKDKTEEQAAREARRREKDAELAAVQEERARESARRQEAVQAERAELSRQNKAKGFDEIHLSEAAQRVGYRYMTLYQAARIGAFPSRAEDEARYVKMSDVLAYIEGIKGRKQESARKMREARARGKVPA